MPAHNEIISTALSRIGLPYKYRVYKGRDVKPPPYATYYFEREFHRGSDERNLTISANAIIELYTKVKEFCLEEKLENELSAYELEKVEEYDDTEELYRITYALTIKTKIRRKYNG